jgi:hypothetical protein
MPCEQEPLVRFLYELHGSDAVTEAGVGGYRTQRRMYDKQKIKNSRHENNQAKEQQTKRKPIWNTIDSYSTPT